MQILILIMIQIIALVIILVIGITMQVLVNDSMKHNLPARQQSQSVPISSALKERFHEKGIRTRCREPGHVAWHLSQSDPALYLEVHDNHNPAIYL